MPYRYLTFDGLDLPIAMTVDDFSTAVSENAIVQALNGNIDVLGSTQAVSKPHIIEYTGLYTELGGFLVTETDDFLVTEDGDYLWTGSDADVLMASFRRLRGKRGVLVRKDDNGDQTETWKYARLLLFEHKREVKNANAVAPVRFVFELGDQNWSAMEESTTVAALGDTVQTDFTVTVSGTETIADCVIEIEADDYIYGIDIEVGTDQVLSWAYASPPVFPTKTIIFDCGRFTVTEDGATRYVGFYLGVAHAIQNWIELAPGDNTISITLNGGPGTATVRFYEQYI